MCAWCFEEKWKMSLRSSLGRIGMLMVLLAAVGIPACTTRDEAQQSRATKSGDSQETRVARGKYLVTIMACNDCHTPFKMGAMGPEPDMSRMLSGHPEGMKLPPAPGISGPWVWHGAATNTAFAGPWGISYAMNLTPDVHAGMATWTEERFIRTMRSGKHFGESRPIMPPMPWQSLGQMTDEDLKSVFAYLRTVPPVKNVVPDWQPPAK